MRLFHILTVLSVVACSSGPTQYVKREKQQGYSDAIINPQLRQTTFQGNSDTGKGTAELYAKFRAIEICEEMKKPYTHILLVRDQTYSKEVAHATSSPNYYYGMSPYYGHYGAMGGVGMAYTGTTTVSNETYTYPKFDVYFECVDAPVDARVSLKPLSSSQMEKFVKDLQGGVSVDDVLEDSPNKGKIAKGDIIYKANGERVGKVIDVFNAARQADNKNLKVEFFRDGKPMSAIVQFKDVTELVASAQSEIIKTACKDAKVKKDSPLCKK